MIYLMPCILLKAKVVEALEKTTGLTSYTIPGRTYAVLVKSNVIVFAKPATRPPITYRRNFGGGDDAA